MSTIRSSVRPSSSKQPWGTILKPEFGLGYQKMTAYEIDQTVTRLSSARGPHKQPGSQQQDDKAGLRKFLPQEKIDEMLERLTKVDSNKIPDSDRRMKSSIYREMGVVASYAWQGYN